MHIDLDMLCFSSRDHWLSRPLSRAAARSLTGAEKLERRKAQWRYRRARQKEASECLHVADDVAELPARSSTRDWLLT
jgi:hypothetical protein